MKSILLLVDNDNSNLVADLFNKGTISSEGVVKLYKFRKEESKETVTIKVGKKDQHALETVISPEQVQEKNVSFIEVKLENDTELKTTVAVGYRQLGEKNWNSMNCTYSAYIKEKLKSKEIYWTDNTFSGSPETKKLHRPFKRKRR